MVSSYIKNIFIIISLLFIISCASEEKESEVILKEKFQKESEVSKMRLTSSAFKEGEMIPGEYTCTGDDVSPPLAIEDVPGNAKGLALVMDDPDAPMGTWVHWVVWNIPANTKEIAKGSEPSGVGGKNSWGKTGYGGPCPPSGTHRYFFKLYALDTELDLPEGATKEGLESAMEGHVLAEAQLMGVYKK